MLLSWASCDVIPQPPTGEIPVDFENDSDDFEIVEGRRLDEPGKHEEKRQAPADQRKDQSVIDYTNYVRELAKNTAWNIFLDQLYKAANSIVGEVKNVNVEPSSADILKKAHTPVCGLVNGITETEYCGAYLFAYGTFYQQKIRCTQKTNTYSYTNSKLVQLMQQVRSL